MKNVVKQPHITRMPIWRNINVLHTHDVKMVHAYVRDIIRLLIQDLTFSLNIGIVSKGSKDLCGVYIL